LAEIRTCLGDRSLHEQLALVTIYYFLCFFFELLLPSSKDELSDEEDALACSEPDALGGGGEEADNSSDCDDDDEEDEGMGGSEAPMKISALDAVPMRIFPVGSLRVSITDFPACDFPLGRSGNVKFCCETPEGKTSRVDVLTKSIPSYALPFSVVHITDPIPLPRPLRTTRIVADLSLGEAKNIAC